jgi:hypothetical protein
MPRVRVSTETIPPHLKGNGSIRHSARVAPAQWRIVTQPGFTRP